MQTENKTTEEYRQGVHFKNCSSPLKRTFQDRLNITFLKKKKKLHYSYMNEGPKHNSSASFTSQKNAFLK
jgi:hypothetical protein